MNRLIVGIVALLAAVAIFFALRDKRQSEEHTQEAVFAIDEPSLVDRISLRDREGNYVDLRKRDGQWWVNDTYPAFSPVMDIFLNKTLSKIQVKGAAPEAAKDNVIRAMITEAIRVDIYTGKEAIRSYYVGGYTPDMKGTYMHMKGSDLPYITYIPGFEGYLSPRYSMVPKEWYSTVIMDLKAEDIASVKLTNHQVPAQSFHLINGENGPYMADGGSCNAAAARSYLELFRNKSFEGYADYLLQPQKDSIKQSAPILRLEVEDRNGKKIELRVFQKQNDGGNTLHDRHGNVLAYDPERFFATFSGFDHLVTIQRYTFGKILADRNDFR